MLFFKSSDITAADSIQQCNFNYDVRLLFDSQFHVMCRTMPGTKKYILWDRCLIENTVVDKELTFRFLTILWHKEMVIIAILIIISPWWYSRTDGYACNQIKTSYIWKTIYIYHQTLLSQPSNSTLYWRENRSSIVVNNLTIYFGMP